MLLPNKVVNTTDSDLYRAIEYYNSLSDIVLSKCIKNTDNLKWLVILFALNYIELRGDKIVKLR